MKKKFYSLTVLLIVLVSSCRGQAVEREVAITFDDLPAAAAYDLETTRTLNRKLLAVISANKIPAVGFVTASRIYVGDQQSARLAIVSEWLDLGVELGNHTFAHNDFHKTSLTAFKDDVIRGESVVQTLLKARGQKLKYFRYPYLHTGRTRAVKDAAQQFLAERGYTIAPVTHDNQEWIFSIVYDRAWKRGDAGAVKLIAGSYVEYMKALFQYYEELSKKLFGYEIRQVLLLHDNRLNSDVFEELVRMMQARGYKFVSLERALQDQAYASSDTYVGAKGPSWLQRWAITRGVAYPNEPQVPEQIQRMFAASD